MMLPLNIIELYLLIVFGDSTVFIILYRLIMHTWVWSKPNPNAYSVNLSNNGIDLHLPGQDPIQAINNLIKKLTGADKSIDEKLNDLMNGYINEKMKDVLVQNLKDKNTDDAITQLIQKKIKEKLENMK